MTSCVFIVTIMIFRNFWSTKLPLHVVNATPASMVHSRYNQIQKGGFILFLVLFKLAFKWPMTHRVCRYTIKGCGYHQHTPKNLRSEWVTGCYVYRDGSIGGHMHWSITNQYNVTFEEMQACLVQSLLIHLHVTCVLIVLIHNLHHFNWTRLY